MANGEMQVSNNSQAAERKPRRRNRLKIGAALVAAALLAGCQGDEFGSGAKHMRPVDASIKRKMSQLNMSTTSPIMMRIFKEESQLEVWKQSKTGKYKLLESFEICKWSGALGPKFKEGDRQAPEGFYEITPGLMNPNSKYHLSFNLGYPNAYDRAHGRTGAHLMVHGACSSRGCYAMTDEQVQDIYALARDSFKGGQRSFQVQAFPFRMTAENMARHRGNEHFEFWEMLKTGYDHFEVTQTPPKISVCESKYVFDATTLVEGVPFRARAQCPEFEVNPRIAQLVRDKQERDSEKFTQLATRYDAREERIQRRDERNARIAAALSGLNGRDQLAGASADATGEPGLPATKPETATSEGPAPVQSGNAVQTAFAPDGKESAAGSFFKRFIPFGGSDAETLTGPIDTNVVPAPKP